MSKFHRSLFHVPPKKNPLEQWKRRWNERCRSCALSSEAMLFKFQRKHNDFWTLSCTGCAALIHRIKRMLCLIENSSKPHFNNKSLKGEFAMRCCYETCLFDIQIKIKLNYSLGVVCDICQANVMRKISAVNQNNLSFNILSEVDLATGKNETVGRICLSTREGKTMNMHMRERFKRKY